MNETVVLPWKERVAALARDSHRAYALAVRVLVSRELAEEAVQEAYRQLLQRPLRDAGHERAVLCLLKTTRHIALDLAKTERNRKRREERQSMPAHPSSPPENLARREVAQAARAALEQLPQKEREAVGFYCELGLSYRDAGEVLGVPESTVSDRVQRGIAQLQRILTVKGYACLTPALIASSIRMLGTPKAPDELLARVEEIVTTERRSELQAEVSPAPRGARVRGRGSHHSTRGPLLPVAALLGLTAGIFVLADKGADPIRAPASPAAAPFHEKSGLSGRVPPEGDWQPFCYRWRLESGVPPEVADLLGAWKAGGDDGRGAAGPFPGRTSMYSLPSPPAKRPLLLQTRVLYRGGSGRVVCRWYRGGRMLPCISRGRQVAEVKGSVYLYDFYVVDACIFCFHEGRIIAVDEFHAPYPADLMRLGASGYEVQEIVFRTLEAREITPELKNSAERIEKLGLPIVKEDAGWSPGFPAGPR